MTVALSSEKLAKGQLGDLPIDCIDCGLQSQETTYSQLVDPTVIYDRGLQFGETGYGQLLDLTVDWSDCGLHSGETSYSYLVDLTVDL